MDFNTLVSDFNGITDKNILAESPSIKGGNFQKQFYNIKNQW